MANFDEYKRQCEPDKKEKSEIWETAIGLQEVDGLKPSAYLIETAKANIEGDITFDEVKTRLERYYISRPNRAEENNTEEADKVSARIAEILSEKTFKFSPIEYINIHKRLFEGIYKFAGKIRDYNITKDEWVLNDDTVFYASSDSIRETLEYDFEQERKFSYKGLNKEQIVEHFAKFVSNLWQIHIFGEGNTRTTAVFAIKYLRSMGYNVNNDLFRDNSWYFRNSLVRANYNNYDKEIYATDKYLLSFFGNLLLGTNNRLSNREMHVEYTNGVVKDDFGIVKDKNGIVNLENGIVKDKNGMILALIKQNKNITVNKISEISNISVRTINRHIKAMKEQGELERVGSDKTGYWEVK